MSVSAAEKAATAGSTCTRVTSTRAERTVARELVAAPAAHSSAQRSSAARSAFVLRRAKGTTAKAWSRAPAQSRYRW